jgi:hypothetical protein
MDWLDLGRGGPDVGQSSSASIYVWHRSWSVHGSSYSPLSVEKLFRSAKIRVGPAQVSYFFSFFSIFYYFFLKEIQKQH